MKQVTHHLQSCEGHPYSVIKLTIIGNMWCSLWLHCQVKVLAEGIRVWQHIKPQSKVVSSYVGNTCLFYGCNTAALMAVLHAHFSSGGAARRAKGHRKKKKQEER